MSEGVIELWAEDATYRVFIEACALLKQTIALIDSGNSYENDELHKTLRRIAEMLENKRIAPCSREISDTAIWHIKSAMKAVNHTERHDFLDDALLELENTIFLRKK